MIRIHVGPDHLRRLTAVPTAAETLSVVRSELFEQWGVVVPPMRFVLDPELPPGGFRFGCEGLVTAMKFGPAADEFSVFWWTGSTAEASASASLRQAATSIVRSPSAPCVVLPDRFRPEVEAAGYTPYGPLDHLTVEISDIVGQWAWQLQSEEVTAELMARLAYEAPVLVSQAEQLPAGLVHSLLVALLRDRVPIRNLPRIVELALRYDAFDPPAPDRLTFVRWGLADVIGSVASRQSDIVVTYLLSKDHETDPGPALVSDLETELRALPATAGTPSLLTSDEARPDVADVLRATHPELLVLGYGDLPPHLNVQPIARIGA